MKILLILFVFYGLCLFLSPFPYLKSYFLLWRYALFKREKHLTVSSRLKQVRFLTKYALLLPFSTILWYLDEIVYSGYRQQLVKPIFIIGQPRSGTTFLHRTLANDLSNFVAIRHIEWRYPYIIIQKLFNSSKLVNKIINKSYWPETESGRVAAKMHPNTLGDWEEDGIFFEECFLHHFFIFLRFPFPDLLHRVDGFDILPKSIQNKILDIHSRVIQKMLFLEGSGNKYYLSKEVTSHNKINKILTLYPDAGFVVSLRSSADFMSSLMALVRKSTESKTGVDPMSIPDWDTVMLNRMREDSLMLCRLCRDTIPEERQVKVLFSDFTTDIKRSIEMLYNRLGLSMSDQYSDYLEQLTISQKTRTNGYDYRNQSFEGFDQFDDFVKEVCSNLQDDRN